LTLTGPRSWLVLALAALAALVALDLATGERVILVALYAVAPVLAALGAGPRPTAVVGGLSVAAAVLVTLVLRGDDMGAQDAVRPLVVVLLALLALWTARLRERAQRSREATREAIGRLDVIFERAPIGLAFFDRELRYVAVNQRLAQINGVPAEAHVGRTTREVLPAMAPSVRVDLRRVLETGEPVLEVEVAGETPAQPGVRREFLVSYWPLRRGEEITGLGAVVLDVTERRAAERALQAQTHRYEALLRALGDVGEGMVVVEDGRAVYANAAFEAMSGRSAAELATLDPFELLVPEQRAGARRRLEAAGELREEVTLRHRDGSLVELEVAGVPLRLEGRTQLVVVARDVTARRQAERERERLLVAEQAARADAEAAERRARYLVAVGTALEEGMSVRRTADRLARAVVGDYAETCVLLLGEGAGPYEAVAFAARTPARERLMADLEARYPLPRQPGLNGHLRPDRPQVLRDLDPAALATDDRHAELLAALGVPHVVIVPLRARGRELGRLAVGFVTLTDGDAETMLALFEEVARRAALALDNARLYEERTTVARTLQRSLLPPELPALPGVELAARYVAAGEGNEVGGDFYDAFSLGGDDWALVIGDVCGKGPEAAAVTALARYTLRASVLHSSHPRDVLAELNEVLLRHGLEYRFASVLFATLRVGEHGVTGRLASGGHPLPYVVRADGTVEPAGRPGTLLGIVAAPNLDADDVELGPGDALVLYTDGVIEASPADDAFGPERFAAFLGELQGEDAEGMADRVERAVLGIQDGRPRDDVAVLVLRVTPERAPFDPLEQGVAAA